MKQKSGIVLPNLFIAGAQKSGTTSLHYFLKTHPDIFFPERPQELHYFDIEKNYGRGLVWFSSHFSAWAGEKVIAQTSPLYMYETAVASRIHAILPEAKFIFILRNPVERAYSHYWHEVRYGYEKLSFEDALTQEENRIRQGARARRHFSYIDRGRYARQILRFLKFYPKRDMLILLLDELKLNPTPVANRCADFLGIETGRFAFVQEKIKAHNTAKLPRILRLQRVTSRLRKPPLRKIGYLIDKINLKPSEYPPMLKETRLYLQQVFREEMTALQELTPLEVKRWL